MNNYKVLWFDDEHNMLETIIEDALQNQIELIGYNNAKDGIEELANNFGSYHAIVVDGLFFEYSNQTEVDTGGSAFGEVAKFLESQKVKGNIIPWFILSGQPSFVKEKNIVLKLFKNSAFSNGKVYDKNDDNDIDNLFLDIKTEIENVDKIRVRIKYSEAFEAIGDNYLPVDVEENLVEVLLAFEKNTWTANSFTPLRKIIEAVYKNLHEYDVQLIPYGCVRFENGHVNFKYCELRLTGRKIEDRDTGQILYERIPRKLPEHLGRTIGAITDVCNKASHESYANVLTKFSLGTSLFTVIDLLIWYKKFIDRNYL